LRRSLLDLKLDVLEVLRNNGGTRITHIVYKANLLGVTCYRILDELLEKKLVIKMSKRAPSAKKPSIYYMLSNRGLDAALCWMKAKEYLR